MPWAEITRPDYDRCGLRYASDVTDAQWDLVAPFWNHNTKSLARVRSICAMSGMRSNTSLRQVAYGDCCQRNSAPVSTVQHHFYRFPDEGLLDVINDARAMASRVVAGRDATPTAGIIDSQSVKTTESDGPHGYDAGKKTKGRKRHIVTDTEGNLLASITHTADIQDRDGAADVIKIALKSDPTLTHIFADGAQTARCHGKE